MSRVEVKKNWLGNYVITYDCPHCSSPLNSSLDDAGKPDTCPECGHQYRVPLSKFIQELQQEVASEAEAKIKSSIEKKKQKQKAKEERAEQRKAEEELKEQEKRRAREEAIRVQAQLEAEAAVQAAGQASQAKQCPYCAEIIQAQAVKCRHCGEFLDGRGASSAQSAPVYVQPTPQTVYVQQPAKGHSSCGLIVIIAFGILFGALLLMFL